jgi:CubicO group peptidase (beta-lactamase class C family)
MDTTLPRDHPVAQRIDRLVSRRSARFSSLVVAAALDGRRYEVTHGRVAGAGSEPVTGSTIFEIGSISKVFTATVLAAMAIDGLVALDDPVQRYLPRGVSLRSPRGRPLTLADLASHTSGLSRLPKGMLLRAIRERRNPYASFGVADLERAIVAAKPRKAGRVRYSNFGAGLLGHVLALRAGVGYERLVLDRICRPLELADTSIEVAGDRLPRFAEGHDRRGRPVPHWDLPAAAGAGGLRSTASDLLRFLEHQLHPASSPIGPAITLTQEPRAGRGRLSVGLGWLMIAPRRGRPRVTFHNGGTGGFRSFAGFVRDRQASVVVLAGSARSVDRLGWAILETLAEPTPSASAARPRAPRAPRPGP